MDQIMLKKLRLELIAMVFDSIEALALADTPEKMVELRYAEIDGLIEKLEDHKRALDFALGKEVKPKVHFAAAVLDGRGGM